MSDNAVFWADHQKWGRDFDKYDEMRKHCFTEHTETCDGDMHSVLCMNPSQHKELMTYFRCGKFCDVYKARENLLEALQDEIKDISEMDTLPLFDGEYMLGEDTVDMKKEEEDVEVADESMQAKCEKVEAPPETATACEGTSTLKKKKRRSVTKKTAGEEPEGDGDDDGDAPAKKKTKLVIPADAIELMNRRMKKKPAEKTAEKKRKDVLENLIMIF